MVATNRLTGHSTGFFSVYTLPPNQAVSAQSQKRINMKREQVPEYRDTHQIILRKTRRLLRSVSPAETQESQPVQEKAPFSSPGMPGKLRRSRIIRAAHRHISPVPRHRPVPGG